MWTMPVPSSSETSLHGITRCATSDARRGRRRARDTGDRRDPRRAPVPRARASGVASDGYHSPSSVRPYSASGRTAAATFGGQRPGGRRPDDERLAVAVEQREADEERRVLELAVLARIHLVLGDRRAAARAPRRRAMALVEPAPLVHDLQEAPDVLDVRVREREVVGVPVHPHPEALRLLGDDLAELATRSLQRAANSARPYSSISRFELSPSAFSTSTSTQRPWQSNPFW